MRLRIHQVTLPIDHQPEDIRSVVADMLGCSPHRVLDVKLFRRSVDARSRREVPVFVYSLELTLAPGPDIDFKHVEILPEFQVPVRVHAKGPPAHRPVVVGAGPAGLMAAITLAEAGFSPIVVERGAGARQRAGQVSRFWQDGLLDSESNVLFGEGGAGLFSDGKLTARSKDRPRVRRFLETLVACGAPETILIDAHPHLGSDVLLRLVPKLSHRIEAAGGEIRLGTRLDDLDIVSGCLRQVVIGGKNLRADACILATGHSARDVYRMLAKRGVPLQPKGFAVGVRIEIPQNRIDTAQWGDFAGNPRLGPASFRLTRKPSNTRRACYSFCMCPGGRVIVCASSPGKLTTNGMSLSRRVQPLGNAAFLVPVQPGDFPQKSQIPELAGIDYQCQMEQAAFDQGGGDYFLPAAALADFLSGQSPSALPEWRSCQRARPADLHRIFPAIISDTLLGAISPMLRQLPGVRLEEAVIYAAETRSSSPVRILKDKLGQSPGAAGLFPAGEGAGYAGGIVSSAVDGICAAESVIRACSSIGSAHFVP